MEHVESVGDGADLLKLFSRPGGERTPSASDGTQTCFDRERRAKINNRLKRGRQESDGTFCAPVSRGRNAAGRGAAVCL